MGSIMGSIELVVARHNEDVSWLRRVPHPAVVYDKGRDSGEPGAVRLPNVGREGHTYAHHIVARFEDLADFTWFLQGRIDDHDRKALDTIVETSCPNGFVALGAHGPWGSRGLKVVDLDCGKHPNLRPVTHRVFRRLFGEAAEVPPPYAFMPGALFGASKAAIRARGLDFWRRLVATLEHDVDPIEGYAVERLWPLIFSPSILLAEEPPRE